jgi:hypothetical protein
VSAPVYVVLPASTSSCGLARAPLSAILACWPASHGPIARAAVDRHPPSGLVHFDGEAHLTRWHVRWLAGWLKGVLRADERELIRLADANGPAR